MMEVSWRLDLADPLIRQHVVRGRVVVPMAFWLSRSVEEVAALSSETPIELVRVLVRKALALEEGAAIDVRFVGMPGPGEGRFEVREVREHGASRGEPLVEGGWRPKQEGRRLQPRSCHGPVLEHERFYDDAGRAGLSYGTLLRRIETFQQGDRSWTAELRSVEEGSGPVASRAATWDAMLQSGAVMAAQGGSSCWLPFGIDRMRLGPGEPGESIERIYGEWTAGSTSVVEPGVQVASLLGFGSRSGALLLELSGVRYGVLDRGPGELADGSRQAAVAPLASVGSNEILQRLRSAPGEQRRALLIRFIEDQLLEVLQWNESKRGDLAAGFVKIGVDSLMSVDLQYRLQTALDFALPLGESFESTSVPDLADSLLDRHLKLD